MNLWTRAIRNEQGAALTLGLIALLVLTTFLLAYLAVSRVEPLIAQNHVAAAKALSIAEAGVERAKRTLALSTARNLNIYLTGTAPGPYLFGDVAGAGNSLDSGNYIARVYDNNDDADPNTDSDDTVFIESTGTYQNARRRVVALVTVPLFPDPAGALEVIAQDQSEVELKKGAAIDGRDWTPPADPSSCVSIAGCGTLTTNPGVAGIAANSASVSVEVQPPSTLMGNPPQSLNGSLSATPWNLLINQLLGKANRTLTSAQTLTGIQTWGTLSAPEISVISAETTIQGTVNGVGILIINNSRLKLDHGTLNWQGLIILRDQAGKHGVELETDDDATARVFGAVVAIPSGADAEAEVEIQNGLSFFKYSSSVLDAVRRALPISVRSWQEVPIP